MSDHRLTFTATADNNVSALLRDPGSPVALLILGHGAGADMHHAHMEAIATALAGHDIATLRFNFPFMEQGRRRTDRPEVCIETIDHAVALASARLPGIDLYAGGHSFGGRMASHYCAGHAGKRIRGLVCFSFPLHPAGKPGDKRAAHFDDIRLPVLFVNGTRDALAESSLLESSVTTLRDGTIHWLDTADHSFKILKRSRQSDEDVYEEAARVTREWLEKRA
ncbi:MAG: alpha/beta fold hydrolase [Pseudomonadales bacterium]|nr:alpha/beta fold hydrolase [Pseudomonadales bacterium]